MQARDAIVGCLYELDRSYYPESAKGDTGSTLYKHGRYVLCIEECTCDRYYAGIVSPHKRFLTQKTVACLYRTILCETTR